MRSCWQWLLLFVCAAVGGIRAADFAATGPTKETQLQPGKSLGAVKAISVKCPIMMSFDLNSVDEHRVEISIIPDH